MGGWADGYASGRISGHVGFGFGRMGREGSGVAGDRPNEGRLSFSTAWGKVCEGAENNWAGCSYVAGSIKTTVRAFHGRFPGA